MLYMGKRMLATGLSIALMLGAFIPLGVRSAMAVRFGGETGAGLKIAAGGAHALAVKPNGTVIAWGDDEFGQTDLPSGLAEVKAIAAGRDHSLALRANGTVVAWGKDDKGQTDVPAGLSGVIAVAAGYIIRSPSRRTGPSWRGEARKAARFLPV